MGIIPDFTPKCRECKLSKSEIYFLYSEKVEGVVLCFYDFDGNLHTHDKSKVKYFYTCSNGHTFNTETYNKCKSCKFLY